MIMKDNKFEHPKELETASEEHFDALFFGWKIGEGLRNNVDTTRIKAYADWFFENYMKQHIAVETKFLFPILGMDNVRVKKAMANHRRLSRLFNDTKDVYKSLNRIEDEIGRFIRFEERVLYKQIEEKVTSEQLQEIKQKYDDIKVAEDEWDDQFWKSK